MTRVYRIVRKRFSRRPLDGEGSFRFGGGWSSPGTRLAYMSEHLSLAMLEYYVHVDRSDLPSDLVVIPVHIDDRVSRIKVAVTSLAADWRASPAPPHLAAIGDAFVVERKSAVLIVPSVLAPSEYNWLLNPAHPDCRRVRVGPPEAF